MQASTCKRARLHKIKAATEEYGIAGTRSAGKFLEDQVDDEAAAQGKGYERGDTSISGGGPPLRPQSYPGFYRDGQEYSNGKIWQGQRNRSQERKERILVVGENAADLAQRFTRSTNRIAEEVVGDGDIDSRKPIENNQKHRPDRKKCHECRERWAVRQCSLSGRSILMHGSNKAFRACPIGANRSPTSDGSQTCSLGLNPDGSLKRLPVAIACIALAFAYIHLRNRLPGFATVPFPNHGNGSLPVTGHGAALPRRHPLSDRPVGSEPNRCSAGGRRGRATPSQHHLAAGILEFGHGSSADVIRVVFELPMSQIVIPLSGLTAPTLILNCSAVNGMGLAGTIAWLAMAVAGGSSALA